MAVIIKPDITAELAWGETSHRKQRAKRQRDEKVAVRVLTSNEL
jgi:hypothetical protein